MPSASRSSYSATAQFFHWATAVLVVVAFVYGLGGSEQRVYLPSRDFERQLHETLGMTVLLLTALRLGSKLFDARPAPLAMPRWMEQTSRTAHGLLYVLLFAVPITAIVGAWLEGHDVTLLAGIRFAPPMASVHDLGVRISELHTWLGDAILWVAGAHALAAIFHHAILKDATLVTMLPAFIARRLPGGR
ncbi:MAG: cytochrome b [Burkholderiaceae bacterium]